MGNARVTLGGPQTSPLPPGAPSGGGPPTIPQVPKPDAPGGMDREIPKTAGEIAVEAALPEGPNKAPVSGFLYFPYTGRNKSIKEVVLLYKDAVLKLR